MSSIGSPAASRSQPPAGEGATAGFTLVETIVAFAIAALLLVAFSHALGLGVAGTERVRAAEEAALLAESALEPLGVIAPLRDGETADLDHGAYRIHVAVERYADGATPRAHGYLALFRLSATVLWHEGRQDRSVTLTTLRLGRPG